MMFSTTHFLLSTIVNSFDLSRFVKSIINITGLVNYSKIYSIGFDSIGKMC